MELSTSSISNSISKLSTIEETSFYEAYKDDAYTNIGSEREHESISNEHILKGDIILDTYVVVSDAIRGGMGSVWCVHHKNWNVDLAMKRPQPRFFAEAGNKSKKQFVEECEHWDQSGLASQYCLLLLR